MTQEAPVTQMLTAESETNLNAARVTKIDSPVASPGNCGLCGKSEHPLGFANLGLDFEFYGTLIFCADCAGTIGQLFGYISSDTYAALQLENITLVKELEITRAALEALESGLDQLANYHHARNASASHAGNDGMDETNNTGSSEGELNEPDNVVHLATRESEPEQESDKSSSEQGPNVISGATGDGVSGELGIDDL